MNTCGFNSLAVTFDLCPQNAKQTKQYRSRFWGCCHGFHFQNYDRVKLTKHIPKHETIS